MNEAKFKISLPHEKASELIKKNKSTEIQITLVISTASCSGKSTGSISSSSEHLDNSEYCPSELRDDHQEIPIKEGVASETLSDWLLLFCACLFNVIVGLQATSFGVMYGDIAQHFQARQSAVGWCTGLQHFTTAMFSILASYPIRRYGCRIPGVTGSFLFALGVCTSSLAPNLWTIYAFHGVIAGIGGSLSVISCTVVVQQRFNKHRPLAAIMTSVGYSLGTITGPHITRLLLNEYGWAGALLVTGAIQCHRIPLALLFKKSKKLKCENSNQRLTSNMLCQQQQITKQCNDKNLHQSISCGKLTARADENHSREDSATSRLTDGSSVIAHSPDGRSKTFPSPDGSSVIAHSSDARSKTSHSSDGSSKITHSPDGSSKTTPCSGLISYANDVLDFSVLKQPTFSLFLISMCLMYLTFGYMAHLPGKCERSGLTILHGVWALSVMSFSSLLSKLVMTALTASVQVSRLLIVTSGGLCGTLSMLALAIVSSTTSIFLSAVLYGIQLACWHATTSVLLVELMGIDLLPRCLALQYFFTGFCRLASAPFIGWIYDITEEYDWAFVCLAVVQFLSFLLLIVLYFCVRYKGRQQKSTEIT